MVVKGKDGRRWWHNPDSNRMVELNERVDREAGAGDHRGVGRGVTIPTYAHPASDRELATKHQMSGTWRKPSLKLLR